MVQKVYLNIRCYYSTVYEKFNVLILTNYKIFHAIIVVQA